MTTKGILLTLALVAGVIFEYYRQKKAKETKQKVYSNIGYPQWVAYHEAGHAVIALYHGMRCLGMMLNINDYMERYHPNLKEYGHASIDISAYKNNLAQIEKTRWYAPGSDQLPKDPDLISFAKRHLQVLYAGDFILNKMFRIPNNVLENISAGVDVGGSDAHEIETLHDYLFKVGDPMTPGEARKSVNAIIDNHKEITDAIHLLANKLIKNPGVTIPEQEILADLKSCNFFDIRKDAENSK